MILSAPWVEYLDICLAASKTIPWVIPMGLSIPMADSLDIIAFQTDKIN